MRPHRVGRHLEQLADLRARQPVHQTEQHVALTVGQPADRLLLGGGGRTAGGEVHQRLGEHVGRDPALAATRRAHRRHERVGRVGLVDPAADAHLHRLEDAGHLLGGTGDDDDADVGPGPQDLAAQAQPVVTGEVEVERDDVDVVALEQLPAVAGRPRPSRPR